jgi:hypothetical protein
LALLHPLVGVAHLAAGAAVGLDNSMDRSLADFDRLRSAFLGQTQDWREAEPDIVRRRDERARGSDAAADALEAAAPSEIRYTDLMWRHDFVGAYQHACAVTDRLGGDELRPYRGYWHYAAAVAADHAWRSTGQDEWAARARDHLGRAVPCLKALHWVASLQAIYGAQPASEVAPPSIDVEVVSDLLNEWRLVGGRFEDRLNEARRNVYSQEAKAFEAGLYTLGRMVGCHAQRFDEAAAPDGWWAILEDEGIVFEAKSDEKPEHPVDAATVRQAAGHETWVRAKLALAEGTAVHRAIVSPHVTIQQDAVPLAGGIYHVHVDEIRQLFDRAASLLNAVRNLARGLTEDALREMLDEQYRAAGLSHADIVRLLTAQQTTDLTRVG